MVEAVAMGRATEAVYSEIQKEKAAKAGLLAAPEREGSYAGLFGGKPMGNDFGGEGGI